MPPHNDLDDFIVWCDDIYGDGDGDGMPELPVSRIPDGRSSQLVWTALQAGATDVPTTRSGLRSSLRPFADIVYELLRGHGDMLRSEPTRSDGRPHISFGAEQVYLVLHGKPRDGSRLWGEDGAGNLLEAVTTAHISPNSGNVVFTGCCWSALTVDTLARDVSLDHPPVQRTPRSSLALQALAVGTRAFLGCTGSHYSPAQAPYQYFAAPLHRAFWHHLNAGMSPAAALFAARKEYVTAIPHGRSELLSEAIERKIWQEYTCLGLGW